MLDHASTESLREVSSLTFKLFNLRKIEKISNEMLTMSHCHLLQLLISLLCVHMLKIK